MSIQSDEVRAVELALAMAANGFRIFPCKSGSKEPACYWQQDATTNAATIQRWFAANPGMNYGVALDAQHFVLDLDVKGERNGFQDWRTLKDTHGVPPKTLGVRTPSGGGHVYWKGSAPNSVGKKALGRGIDVRGLGGYVLGPGSVIGGNPYTVAHDNDIAVAPDWLVTLAACPSVAPQKRDPSVALDEPGEVARVRQYLAGLVEQGDVAIEHCGGNDRTYRLFCEVLDHVSEQEALALITEHWNPQCQPPWSDGELQTILTNATGYRQNDVGSAAVAPASEIFANLQLPDDPAVSLAPKTAAKLIRPIPFTDLLKREVKAVEEVIPGLLEKNIATMLSGPGGVNKSRLALQWGLCLQAGLPIFGRAVLQSTFVHLSYEDSKDEVTRRVQTITRRLAIPNADNAQLLNYADPDAGDNAQCPANTMAPPLATVSETEIKLEPLYYELYEYLRSLPGHKFIVADSTYNVLRFTGQSKINETAVKQAIELLNYLCRATNSTMLFLWHPSQAGQERGDSSGWSVAWNNTPRARLSLSAVKNTEGAYLLAVEKRNNGPKGQPITLHWNDGVLLPRSEVDTAQQSTLFLEACIKVAAMSAENGAPITQQRKLFGWQIDEIERDAGYRPSQPEIKEELARAVRLGRLRYIKGHGKQQAGYFLIEGDPASHR